MRAVELREELMDYGYELHPEIVTRFFGCVGER